MKPIASPILLGLVVAMATACADGGDATPAAADAPTADTAAAPASADPAPPATDATAMAPPGSYSVTSTEIYDFDAPWAMTFLPDDGRLLVTETAGKLMLVDVVAKTAIEVAGAPKVVHRGQGGFGDVVVHPEFANNRLVYLSWVEAGQGGTGAVVGRGKLVVDADGGAKLDGLEVIWRQTPKMDGNGHFGHRIAFGPDGRMYISNGDRQHFDPAQDMKGTLGKIVRLNDDGTPAEGNPFANEGGVTAQIWSLGHRNILGMAFDANGQLWAHEMGPAGGDEFNRISAGKNYGYPIVSDGDHYDGKDIPDHSTRPEFETPLITWTPVIAPAGMIIYSGSQFPEWRGDAFIGGLKAQALVRVEFDGTGAREAQRLPLLGERIREVEQGPEGFLWVLEDGGDDGKGRLLKLTPSPL